MFHALEAQLTDDATLKPVLQKGDTPFVFQMHPLNLSRWLDEVWSGAQRVPQLPADGGGTWNFVDTEIIRALDFPSQPFAPDIQYSGLPTAAVYINTPQKRQHPPSLWNHLIYAYLIESTGIVEIFAQVVRRLVSGETLGTLSPASLRWARATEQLFFRDAPEFSIAAVTSELRANARENRRNAYLRFFGMDLPHPIPQQWRGGVNADAADLIGSGANADFRQKWNELLRQVQIARQNVGNEIGPNPADPAYIALLCGALRDMFANRRRGGALAREEFSYVTMLSWFHLTVSSDSPIVRDLQAVAASPADRLQAIASRVGLVNAPKSRELFELAEPMSMILRGIEIGLFDTEATAAALFSPAGSKIARDMNLIINNWQSATEERVKDPVVTVVSQSRVQSQPQPLSAPTPGVVPAREGAGLAVPVR